MFLRLSALICLVLAAPAFADDPDRGQRLFLDHCATCHGSGASGDGPMAAVLSVAPADLTGLSARNDDIFPIERVIKRIDGTEDVMAHGGPMPLFGLLLDGPSEILLAPDGSDVVAPEGIADIVVWLSGLQR